MSIIHNFAEIAKEARLRALEGFNQNESKPVEMPCDSNPQDSEYFYGVGFVAGQNDDTELYGADIGCLSA